MRSAIPLLLFLSSAAVAQTHVVPGDPIAGERLAKAQCAECHLVPGDHRATAIGVPSFVAIAQDKRITELALRAFLQTPHDRMPNIVLSRREIDDLIAYILTYKSR